jgi:Ca2+-binding RTX toxin-like protein
VRLFSAALLAVLGIAAVPALAQAHSAVTRVRGSTLVYEQLGPKPEFTTNRLTVSDGTGNIAGFWKFRDPPAVGITNSPPCVPLDTRDREVVCPTDQFKLLLVLVKLGNDRVTVTSSKKIDVHGGPGNDVVNGGRGPERLYGDAGDDRLTAGRNGGALLDGGNGNDVLDARNGKKDTIVACATDTVKRDAIDVVKSGCG